MHVVHGQWYYCVKGAVTTITVTTVVRCGTNERVSARERGSDNLPDEEESSEGVQGDVVAIGQLCLLRRIRVIPCLPPTLVARHLTQTTVNSDHYIQQTHQWQDQQAIDNR